MICFIACLYTFHHPCRCSSHHTIAWHIVRYCRISRNNHVVADVDTGQDYRLVANPDVVADYDLALGLQVAFLGRDAGFLNGETAVTVVGDHYVTSGEQPVADGDFMGGGYVVVFADAAIVADGDGRREPLVAILNPAAEYCVAADDGIIADVDVLLPATLQLAPRQNLGILPDVAHEVAYPCGVHGVVHAAQECVQAVWIREIRRKRRWRRVVILELFSVILIS